MSITLGWICKMLRNHRVKVSPGIRGENRANVTDGETQSKRKNDTRDCDSPELESQAHRWLSRLLRR